MKLTTAWEYDFNFPRGSFTYYPEHDEDIPQVGEEVFLFTYADRSRVKPYGMIVKITNVTALRDKPGSAVFVQTDFPERTWRP